MTAPAQLVQVGLAREPAFGAGTAPTGLLACKPPQVVDNNPPLIDASWRTSAAAAFGWAPGPLDSNLTLTGPVRADSIGYLLAGALGDLQFAAGTPNTWTMSLLNSGTQQPGSYAVWVSDPTGPLLYAGCRVSKLAVTFTPEDLLNFTADLAGLAATVPGAVNMPAMSGESVQPGWAAVAQIGGVTSSIVLDASVQLQRTGVVAKRNVTGTQTPWTQRVDTLDVTGSLALAARDDGLRQQFVAGSQTSVDLNLAVGAGAGSRQLRLHCSGVVLTQVSRTWGQRWVEVTAQWRAVASAADAGASGGVSPVKATLANTVGSGTY